MEDVVAMTLVKFIIIGIIVPAFLVGLVCVLKAVACALKEAEEEEEDRRKNNDK